MNNALKNAARGELAGAQAPRAAYAPRVDVLETADELTFFADVPGVRPDDADVRFENGELVLHGRCEPRAGQGRRLLAEYGVGDFYRAFTVNAEIDAARITAGLKHGVLTVRLPKAEAAKPRQITVKGE